ncbi:hypothetical protein [Streptomyces justiciae]|uniref:Uncharacterized protein n=1 Tax=Streptomyces justiciae TaxID=2780140 RepID=A0ABU3M6P5_9ACTN|nr:hypothetical protein [Streptomyces justiciae]MDT7847190.1 hypothetical protein [Streptomyces justiciae]
MSTSSKKSVGTEVVELDLIAQQRRDALPKPTNYTLFGVAFTMPPIKSLPMDLQERIGSLENGYGVMVECLGEEKVQEMVDAGYTLGDLEVIAEDWQKRNGLAPGESKASRAS